MSCLSAAVSLFTHSWFYIQVPGWEVSAIKGYQWHAQHDGYTLISPHSSSVPKATCSFPPNAKPLLSPCNLGWELSWWGKRILRTAHQPACTKPPSFLRNLLEGAPQSETCAWIKLKAPKMMLSVFLSVWSIIIINFLPPQIFLSDPFELQPQNLYFAQYQICLYILFFHFLCSFLVLITLRDHLHLYTWMLFHHLGYSSVFLIPIPYHSGGVNISSLMHFQYKGYW